MPTIPKKALLSSAAALALSACGTLYTTSHDWRLPGGLAQYTITATMDVGLFVSHATIAVNGRQILAGDSAFFSDEIDMAGSIDNLPITAACNRSSKRCDVSIAGIHAATLSF
jgi:hypothetical protein